MNDINNTENTGKALDSYVDEALSTPVADNPFDDADFKDFDDGATKNTLADMWNNNPFMKLGIILGGIILLVGGFILFGGKEEPPISEVNTNTAQAEAPGGNVNEAYRSAVEEVNQQRLETAQQQGTSAIPIPLAGPTIPETYPPGQPDTGDEDPLAQWRAAAQAPVAEPEPPAAPEPEAAAPVVQQQQAAPVENPYTALMQQQMGNILNAQVIAPPRIMQVTNAEQYLASLQPAAETLAVAAEEPKPQEIIVAAGSMNYATMMLEANSDVPGPVMAKLQSGPLAGSKILGSFTNTEDYMTITFNTLVKEGVSYPINAIAINPNTTLTGVVTEKNSRYFKRVILPAAAEFMTGFAEAVVDYGKTDVSVNGDTVTSETRELDTEEQLYKGLGEGIKVVGEEAQRRASAIKPLVKVAVGTPVGILFLEPIIKDDTISVAR